MVTINLQQKTSANGHLVIDVPTLLIDKNVDVILTIRERNEVDLNNGHEEQEKKKYDFTHLYGRLEWNGDALAEQKQMRSEWK